MFTLQRLNVVRIVATEAQKVKLIEQGFVEIAEETGSQVEETVKEAKKAIKSKSK